MVSVNEKRENSSYTSYGDRSGSIRYIQGKYRRVYIDNEGKEFIKVKGKNVYIENKKSTSIIDDLKRYENRRRAQAEEYFAKADEANQTYSIARKVKDAARKSLMAIFSKTNCQNLNELKEFQQLNGGSYLAEAIEYSNQAKAARSTEIRAESDSIFYGYMACDEIKSANDTASLGIIAQNILYNG